MKIINRLSHFNLDRLNNPDLKILTVEDLLTGMDRAKHPDMERGVNFKVAKGNKAKAKPLPGLE